MEFVQCRILEMGSTVATWKTFTLSFTSPLEESNAIHVYCDANWGPMDASVPKQNSTPCEQPIDSLRSLSGWFIMNAGAKIAWGCARHKDTAQSSCQAEVHIINETMRLLLEYRLLFRNIGISVPGPIA